MVCPWSGRLTKPFVLDKIRIKRVDMGDVAGMMLLFAIFVAAGLVVALFVARVVGRRSSFGWGILSFFLAISGLGLLIGLNFDSWFFLDELTIANYLSILVGLILLVLPVYYARLRLSSEKPFSGIENVFLILSCVLMVVIVGNWLLSIWANTAKNGEILRLNEVSLRDVLFSPAGNRLLLVSCGGVDIWDPVSGTQVANISPQAKGCIEDASLTADGLSVGLVLSVSDWSQPSVPVEIWNLTSLQYEEGFEAFGDDELIEFSPDGNYIVMEHTFHDRRNYAFDFYLNQIRSARVMDAEFSPAGELFAQSEKSRIVGSDDGRILSVWRVQTQELLYRYSEGDRGFEHLAFSPDGKILYASVGKSIRIFDMQSGEEVDSVTASGDVGNFDVSPDGKYLSIGAGNTLEVWDLFAWSKIARVRGHAEDIRFMVYSHDGRLLVSGDREGSVFVWEVAELLR